MAQLEGCIIEPKNTGKDIHPNTDRNRDIKKQTINRRFLSVKHFHMVFKKNKQK